MFIIIIELISYQLHKFDVQAKRNPQITRNRETIVNPCTRRIHIKIEDSTNKKKKDKKSTKHNNFSTFQTKSGGRGVTQCLPGGLEEVSLAVHQFVTELGHLLFHLTHLGIETFAYAAEFRVDNAEVSQFDGDISLVSLGHF